MNSIQMKNTKVLVIGGAGFVGSNLCHILLKKYGIGELWIVDNLLSSDISNVPEDSRVKFLFGSITDNKILNSLPLGLDFVFHLACYHGNQSSISDPLADHENNALTSLKLFETIKSQKSIKKIVYAAAGCAVAEKTFSNATATTEDAPISLFHDSPYSISKIIGEMYGNFYYSRYGMPFVKARFQNVYGPKEILGAGRWRGTVHTIWRNVIPTFIWKALHKEALPLDNGGNASRDFIYVEDITDGLIRLALKGLPGEAYNLASGVETSIKDLAILINELTGNNTPLNFLPARDWDHSGKRFGSIKKSREELGFEATMTLKEGLRHTIEWTVANKDLINQKIIQHNYFINSGSYSTH